MTAAPPTGVPAKHPKLHGAWIFCTTKLASLIFKMVEAATVLGVFVLAFWVSGFLVFADVGNTTRQRMVGIVQLINENWKAFVLLAVPLFYRSLRTFIEEVQEFASLKRQKSRPEGEASQRQNPPSPGVEAR